MVTDSINSFVSRDLEMAKKVIRNEDVVDDYFDTVKNELIDAISNSHPEEKN